MTSAKAADQGKDASTSIASKSRSPSKDKSSSAPGSDAPARTSKKRRKVNHDVRNAQNEAPKSRVPSSEAVPNAMPQQISASDAGLNLAPNHLPPNRTASTSSIPQADSVPAPQMSAMASGSQPFLNYDDLLSNSQNNFQDMHHFHPSYMFNTSEVSNEYNLFNDFLNNNLMDDGSFYGGGDFHTLFSDASLMNTMSTMTNNSSFDPNASRNAQLLPPPAQSAVSRAASRPSNNMTVDKARERYLMAAADPAGNDSPEERMNKLLKAKMDAGLLKPFNYVKGYARLNQYMEQNLQQISRVRILRQLDRFRPKFRERVSKLTDMELVRVEMWFDKSLMEYDRVFASMAIPACCWRRTGEIYRGNKEMARLIHAPMSKLRDGNIALHEIIAEPSLVSYWEKFGAIAFDHTQKAILTSCSLKNPDPNSKDPEIRCCFSFTVKRDMWNIPALIQPAANLEREKKVHAVIAFASTLESRLGNTRDTTLRPELQKHIRYLPLQSSPVASAKRTELDKLGTKLWNLSTRLRRNDSDHDGEDDKDKSREIGSGVLLSLLRTYAFLLLDSASGQKVRGRERKTCIRLLKIALKAAKGCVLTNDLDCATRVLEQAATYEETLNGMGRQKDGDDVSIASRLQLEYFTVRAALAFRQSRLDMAEHMFAKGERLRIDLDPFTAEVIADLLYEIGKHALMKSDFETATKWLERSCALLEEQDIGMLSSEAGELRLCVLQGLVQANMKLQTAEAINRAWELVKLMETDYSDKLVVSLLKIELISSVEPVNGAEYYKVLARMIRTIVLNDTNFKTIVFHIRKLKEMSNLYACQALDNLLQNRLLREANGLWVGKAIVVRVWLGTSDAPAGHSLEQLQKMMDSVMQEPSFSLSAPATHAAQTLIWKVIEETTAREQYNEAEAWCQLCLHPIFEKADDILSKQLQIVKLELEAALKLQQWDDLEELFKQCWNCKSSDRYETLADLVLVIHSALVHANVAGLYQSKVLSALQKIINLTSKQNGSDVAKLSRWLRCLFNLTLSLDESISLKCLDQVTQIAAKKHGYPRRAGSPLPSLATPPPSSPLKLGQGTTSANLESKQSDCYPATELEWMATSAFNRAVDYFVSDDDAKCKLWAEKAMTVAQWLEDDGQLRDLLMGKFSALQFNK
ncbi:hypothetical protein E8E13_009809 [Curvularia kusanoi]|uniref:ERT1/acuK family PAS domain-containing protein n=1 Tax=Curvularia kusanoi TaxID=90978 RepID=A0A9P4TMI1_CURKU|nr:hypothetical protein E8E13_009809 [Curvularia kusanoi]